MQPFENPSAQCASAPFQTVNEYAASVRARAARGGGRSGTYSRPFGAVLSSLFARGGAQCADPALTVTQGDYALYRILLEDDPFSYSLDRFAARAVLSLPPDYSSAANRAVYAKVSLERRPVGEWRLGTLDATLWTRPAQCAQQNITPSPIHTH